MSWIGGQTIGLLTETGILTALLVATAQGGARALTGRARMRGVDLLANIRDAGPSALLIVSTVNFLIGAILAFVGAVQLRKFAADIYVADLVGLAVVREMAAVMTAIIMAGRTGGAYAARIATMQGNEEIDALQVIGIPVSDYIVLPSILALVFTMPFLYLYGCLVGMFGGFVVSIAMLSVTGPGYLYETLGAVPFDQFVFGFVKSHRLRHPDRRHQLPHRPEGRPQRRRCRAWRQPERSSPALSASSPWTRSSPSSPTWSAYDRSPPPPAGPCCPCAASPWPSGRR